MDISEIINSVQEEESGDELMYRENVGRLIARVEMLIFAVENSSGKFSSEINDVRRTIELVEEKTDPTDMAGYADEFANRT